MQVHEPPAHDPWVPQETEAHGSVEQSEPENPSVQTQRLLLQLPCRVLHDAPQLPQLLLSEPGFTHVPEQSS